MAVVLGLGACTGSPTSAPTSSASVPASSGPASTGSTTTTAPATTSTTSATGPAAAGSPSVCALTLAKKLPLNERTGQLLMVGLDTGARTSSLDSLVQTRQVGGVILLGGWSGAAKVRAATTHLNGLAKARGLGLLLAADQEGGEVQQLRGAGFSTIPSARSQDAYKPAQLTAAATPWARELAAVGINVNLAPVADTVPASLGTRNGPIGHWGRQFSSDPKDNARMVAAFVTAMHHGGVAATVKHFPGIGRIVNNTDFYATGITDTVTDANDPYLEPFASGIRAGADLVMVGSAIYTKLDPGVNAVFSKRIVTDLLRDQLGWQGVTITDDVGNAKAVAATPVGERATKFIAAGGDIVLTARPADVTVMHEAITAKARGDAAFARQVLFSAARVIDLKGSRGLGACRPTGQ